MSSLSPRTGLTLMADSDFVSGSVVTGNAGKLDNITSILQCTSATRPSSPIDGQFIYETDTQNRRRYDATSGKWYLQGGSGTNCPKGLIGSFSNTSAALTGPGGGISPGVNFFGAPISLLDYSFPVKAFYQYRVIEQGFYMEAGTFNTNINNVINDDMELYTLFGVNSNPGLVTSGTGFSYLRSVYQSQENGSRRSYFKNMAFGVNFTGTLYMRSLFRSSVANAGRPADSIGSYAWAYELGPIGSSY